ncbi:hypothetical protein CYCD_30070 [Tenuifilaceae bacterium CYCD]|nr:hypothetical protein CYCD_30070 [Tenuifilaceae bacterium CYCD]
MKHYKKFADCFLVKGYVQNLIYDISRKDAFSIDSKTFNVLSKDVIQEKLLLTLQENIVEELLEKEVIFPCLLSEAKMFPAIKATWIGPFQIQSCIVDIDNHSSFEFYKIISQLSDLGCRALQLRFASCVRRSKVLNTLGFFSGSNILSVELILPSRVVDIEELISKYKMLTTITLYGADKCSFAHLNGCVVFITTENYYGIEQCGVVEAGFFVCNRELYFESLNCNSCLNRKISIEVQGNIKNCPSCTQSFGNIKDTTLKQSLEHPDFKKLWSITKDQVDVCKDCEFRHMCTDCRVYIKDPENIYSRPAKCNYNPYIAKWQGEEGYVPVEECGTYSRETGFVVNPERVAELNAQIWGV